MSTDANVEQRSVEELLTMIARREGPRDLVEAAGGLERLSRADAFEIAVHLRGPARGPAARVRSRDGPLAAAWALAAAFELGRRAEAARAGEPKVLASPADVAAWARPRLATLSHEELWVLGLDGRGRLRAARCVAKGGLHGAAIRTADPLRAALRVEAAAFVLVHNHPSGDPTPSREDVAATAGVAAAAAVVGVPLLDHVIVARSGFRSVSPKEALEARRE